MYNTIDYLSDEYWLFDKIFDIYKSLRPKLLLFILRKKIHLYSLNYKRFVKRVVRNLPFGIIIIYLGFLATTSLGIFLEKDQGLRMVILNSGSMEPSIPIPSIIFTLPSNLYKVGDIVTYKFVDKNTNVSFKQTITHRIIEEKNENGQTFFITKGDANDVPDPQIVTADQILGKVFITVPYLGYFPLLIKTVPGFMLLIALPCYLLLKNELKYLTKETGN